MKQGKQSSRRSFLQKMAAGSVALCASGIAGAKIFTKRNKQDIAATSEKKFVPVMITPYKSDGKIDFDTLSKLIDFYLAAGVKGFFANCLSSEMYKLTPDERLAITRHVVKYVNGAVPVVATGSFGETMKERAEFTQKIYHTGINAVILITSHFANKEDSDEILINSFEKFFTLTDNIPVGTYECPSPYKRVLTPEVFKYLLATNRLVYHKDTTLDIEKIKVKLELAKNNRIEFYDAHTPNAMYSLQMGAKGISAIAGNFYPEVFAWMCNHVNNPDKQQDVKWLQSELTRVDSIVSQSYPMSSKYFLQKRGVPVQLISRTSTATLTKQQTQTLDDVYKTLLGWHERLGIKSAF